MSVLLLLTMLCYPKFEFTVKPAPQSPLTVKKVVTERLIMDYFAHPSNRYDEPERTFWRCIDFSDIDEE